VVGVGVGVCDRDALAIILEYGECGRAGKMGEARIQPHSKVKVNVNPARGEEQSRSKVRNKLTRRCEQTPDIMHRSVPSPVCSLAAGVGATRNDRDRSCPSELRFQRRWN
jgi:hypothetical protein